MGPVKRFDCVQQCFQLISSIADATAIPHLPVGTVFAFYHSFAVNGCTCSTYSFGVFGIWLCWQKGGVVQTAFGLSYEKLQFPLFCMPRINGDSGRQIPMHKQG
jgi:hypothetical protein